MAYFDSFGKGPTTDMLDSVVRDSVIKSTFSSTKTLNFTGVIEPFNRQTDQVNCGVYWIEACRQIVASLSLKQPIETIRPSRIDCASSRIDILRHIALSMRSERQVPIAAGDFTMSKLFLLCTRLHVDICRRCHTKLLPYSGRSFAPARLHSRLK